MDEMLDGNVSVTKTVNFPYSLLSMIDRYGKLKGFSRTKIVICALREYVKNHKVEDALQK